MTLRMSAGECGLIMRLAISCREWCLMVDTSERPEMGSNTCVGTVAGVYLVSRHTDKYEELHLTSRFCLAPHGKQWVHQGQWHRG
jgi:hypothetical protein